MMMTSDGTRFCTGTLINNSSQNRRQLFLTANHCLVASPSRFVAIFNYQFPTCNSTNVEPGVAQSAVGMRLVSTWAPSDFALLEIVETIPNSYRAYLAGWNMAKTAPSNVFGVHHPSCDVKKISYYTGTTRASYWTESPRTYHWMIPAWTRGTTEPGSSGSGLFNSNGHLVGQLHGGAASCSNPGGYDLYGAIAYSWTGGQTASTRLRDYLNPRNLWISSLAGMELHR
jgi:V8-like Glu-specific endopeptidase